MPSYIELDKQLSFPASSNVGKLILGVNSSGKATLTDSTGVTTVIGGGASLPYKSYVAKVRVDGEYQQTFGSGDVLTIGQTYLISTADGGDFSNIAEVLSGGINTAGCVFRATGTVPNTWGLSVVTSYGNPIPDSIQENNLGFSTSGSWVTVDNGYYVFNFDTPVDPSKIATFFTPSGTGLGVSFIDPNGSSTSRIDEKYFTKLSSTGTGTGITGGMVRTTAKSISGSILIGGDFTAVNGISDYRGIFRTFDNGLIDTAFSHNFTHDGGFDASATINTIKVQSDNKIILAGNFKGFNHITTKNYILRLNSDGTEDTTFYSNLLSTGDNTGFDKDIRSIDIQSDGKIIVLGAFGKLNGISRTGIVRLNSDGTEDTTFYSNFISTGDSTGFTAVEEALKVLVQPDDKILVTIVTKFYNGVIYKTTLYRFNSDGTFDNTFYNNYVSTGDNSGTDGSIYAAALQSDSKILIGGNFPTINGYSHNKLARLNTDGTVDTTYASQIVGTIVYDIVVEGDHDVSYVMGDITDYGDYGGTNKILKLSKDAQLVNAFIDIPTIPETRYSLTVLPFNNIILGIESIHPLTRIITGYDAFFNAKKLDGDPTSKFPPMQFEIRKYD